MIVVTGGAGFIGSNLVRTLNARGRDDILVVEDLSDGHKALNLADCRIADYLDHAECRRLLDGGGALAAAVETVFHLGACSDTTEWDGRFMMERNFAFSRALFEHCAARAIPLVYASSAAVYGAGNGFTEEPVNERPLNVYGYSKLVFDQYVRRRLPALGSPVVGLRYFNVYGPREQHKGRMASVAWHLNRQLDEDGRLRLFGASHGCAAGEQRRDFVHVDDVVDVTLWAATLPVAHAGIYNCGSGRAETFNAVARAIVATRGAGVIEYIEFPDGLRAAYQAYTCADLTRLRAAGYAGVPRDVARGVGEYVRWLSS
ncbi:MAG: ADP-glyceromanno-heptose 6-epimerase [Gammaproteobacteria bacterium]